MFPKALKATIPVLLGYFPIGVGYGLLFTKLGYPWFYASLTACFVYAGAAQFLSVGLLLAHTGIAEIFVAVLLLNLRHIFYGFSFIRRFETSWPKKILLIGLLTDETYSLLTSRKPAEDGTDLKYCLYVNVICHSCWLLACTIGAFAGEHLKLNTQGLEFALVALFVVLSIEQAKTVRKAFPFLVAVGSAVLAIVIYQPQMLFIALLISTAAILVKSKYGDVQRA